MQLEWEFLIYFIIIGIGICIWACKNRSKQDLTDYQGSHSPRTSSISQDRKKARSVSASQVVQLTMCSECEATIHADETVCPHCGTPLPICSVCHHSIEFGESILICPHCNSQAHRAHILEYLKVKGVCPNCQADLDEYELLEPDVHSDDEKK